MEWISVALTIVLAGFIGWITTWLAIKMLFHPRRPLRLGPITLHGVFPKNQQLIAEKLGQVVGRELLSYDDIQQKITDPKNLEKLRPDIEAHIDLFLREKLKLVFPMLSMLIGDKTINQLKDAFLLELEQLFPILMNNYMNRLQSDLDLERIVRDKVASFSSDRLEHILLEITRKEFKFLELISLIMGVVIGIVQVVLHHWLG
jgi:uncharacterized membrane protein YheB (UPF0754 family)